MPAKFNMYIGVTPTELDEFERLWHLHKASLKPLPNEVHNSQDGYAAVFNTWIRYTKIKQTLIVKPNRLFVHGSVHALSTKLKNYMPSIVRQQILDYLNNPDYMFIYSYNITRNILILLEEYLEQNNALNKYDLNDYYYIEDYEIPENSDLYLLIKDCMFGFVNKSLNEKLITLVYFQSISQTNEAVKQIVNLKLEECQPEVF